MSSQETDIVGYDNIFEKECSADKHICKISSEKVEPFFLYQKYDLPIYDVLDPTFEKPEEPKPGSQSSKSEAKEGGKAGEDSDANKRRFLQPSGGGGDSGGGDGGPPSDSGGGGDSSGGPSDNNQISLSEADNIGPSDELGPGEVELPEGMGGP